MDNKLTEYVLKHSRKRDKELKYDFMPSLLEIIERPAHKAGTVIIIGVFTLLIAAIVWACLSKIDVVVTASGNIQPIGNLQTAECYTNGTVKSINVSEGEYVNKGDVLINLDTQALEIDENQLNGQKKILEAQQDIYTKIKNSEDLSKIKIDSFDAEVRANVGAILDADESYKNSLENLEKEKSTADLNEQIANIQLEEYRSEGNDRQAQIQELAVQQYTLSKEQIDLKISDTKKQYDIQVNSNLAEIQSKIDEIDADLEKYKLSKEYQEITAPVSGYVGNIAVNTIGETVSQSEQLVTIVPDNTPSEMVCYVKNMDIADIQIGMETEIKLEAYPYNKYGTVKGKVKYISPSSFTNEQMGSVYLVKIEITDVPDGIEIISGLTASVEIKTGKRTVMDYFLEPIKKGFGESLKEK